MNDFTGIKKILEDTSIDLPKEELQKIIDCEVSKPEDEMDTELIEYCLDEWMRLTALEEQSAAQQVHPRFRAKRVLALAAAIIVVFSLAVSASDAIFQIGILDGIVEFYNTHVRIRFDRSDDSAKEYKLLGTELAQELEANGISPVLLPELVLTEAYKITDIKYVDGEILKIATIRFSFATEEGYIQIEKYGNKDLLPSLNLFSGAEFVEKVQVSSIDVLLFKHKTTGEYSIVYQDQMIQYTIATTMTYEATIALATSIM